MKISIARRLNARKRRIEKRLAQANQDKYQCFAAGDGPVIDPPGCTRDQPRDVYREKVHAIEDQRVGDEPRKAPPGRPAERVGRAEAGVTETGSSAQPLRKRRGAGGEIDQVDVWVSPGLLIRQVEEPVRHGRPRNGLDRSGRWQRQVHGH